MDIIETITHSASTPTPPKKLNFFEKIKAKKVRKEQVELARTKAINERGWEKINVPGDVVERGIGDPSVEYGADGIGWMSYSRVLGQEVAIHLAKSEDHGRSWVFVKPIVEPNSGKSLSDMLLEDRE